MYIMDKRKWNRAKYDPLFHTEKFFGLARSNYFPVHEKDVSGWKPPEKQTIARNVWCVRNFVKAINDTEANNKSYE